MLAFMHFVHEDKKPVREFLRAWKDHQFHCKGPAECEVCEVGESCAIHEGLKKP
jgi:hypothetical protein